MELIYKIKGGDFTQAGTASSSLKKIMKQLGVDSKIIRRTVIALYEAEVNVVAHAYEGQIVISIDRKQVKIILEDKGPGIPDIEMAMQKGFTTASAKVREMGFGAGMGLPNIKNNTDVMELTSVVGKGTRLLISNYINE